MKHLIERRGPALECAPLVEPVFWSHAALIAGRTSGRRSRPPTAQIQVDGHLRRVSDVRIIGQSWAAFDAGGELEWNGVAK